MQQRFISPRDASFQDLMVNAERRKELQSAARHWPSLDLSERQLCDLELLLNGAFSPLQGFLPRHDYESVCLRQRLADGTLWPIPIVLDISEEFATQLSIGSSLALRDSEGVLLAVMHVSEVWQPDRIAEAKAVYGTTSRDHSGVRQLLDQINPYYAGGRLEGVELPSHHDFPLLRFTPAQLRAEFARMGWRRIMAFPTNALMHDAEFEMTRRVAKEAGCNLLIRPVVGTLHADEGAHYSRIRCYQALLPHYPPDMAKLALLAFATRFAGARELVLQAIIHKNSGCTHLIADGDHVFPHTSTDEEFSLRQCENELGITIVQQSRPSPVVSDAELYARISRDAEIPESFTFHEVIDELRRSHPPRRRKGFTIFFTGLSGAGKSTIAKALLVKLLELGDRPVTLLDGDIVRKHLSSELGFSREHRDINIRRIGYVASEITKHRGIAICAPIAPYDSVRKEVRQMVAPLGGFILVHVSTSLQVCEQRDRKGLYAKARMGLIHQFTGISDPYESPADAELVLDTVNLTPDEGVAAVITYLEQEGYIRKLPDITQEVKDQIGRQERWIV
jgi:sulfate adenylyltransferase